MCGECWNAAMGAPAAVVAARFAWVGYKDRLPFVGRRDGGGAAPSDGGRDGATDVVDAPAPPEATPADPLVDAGAPAP